MEQQKRIGTASAQNDGEIYKTTVSTGDFHFIVDEPKRYGGKETGPAPADYLCIALASCKAITIRMYAQRKGWYVETVNVNVNFVKGDQTATGLNTFFCEIILTGTSNDEQRKRILEIAKVCPIERLLGKQNNVETAIK